MSTFPLSLPFEHTHGSSLHHHPPSPQPALASSFSVMPSSSSHLQHSSPSPSRLLPDLRRSVDSSTSRTTITTTPDPSAAAPYYGVRKRRWGRWVSEIREPKKKRRIWLGSFAEPEMAARAYDVAARCLRGGAARLNFPHLTPFLPSPASAAPEDIQAAAQAAAHLGGGGAFQPCAAAGCDVSRAADWTRAGFSRGFDLELTKAECGSGATIESSSDSASDGAAATGIQQLQKRDEAGYGHSAPEALLMAKLEMEEGWEGKGGSGGGGGGGREWEEWEEWRMWDIDEWVGGENIESKSGSGSFTQEQGSRRRRRNGESTTSNNKSSCASWSADKGREAEEQEQEQEQDQEEYIMDQIVVICRTTTTMGSALEYNDNVYGEMNAEATSSTAQAYDDLDSQQLLMINLWDCFY